MLKRLFFIFLLCFSVIGANSPSPTIMFDAIIEQRIQWIDEHTNYKDTGHPRPTVIQISSEGMKVLWMELTGGEYDGGIRALHVWDPSKDREHRSTIYLRSNFDLNNIRDQRTMSHEVTHFLQHTQINTSYATSYECTPMLEYYARQVGNQYIKEELSSNNIFFNRADRELQKLEGTCK